MKNQHYKPEYGFGGWLKGLGSVLGGGAMQLGSALGFGKAKSTGGESEFATKADLANIQAEIESLKSGTVIDTVEQPGMAQPGMADMELKAQQAQQRPLEAGTGFGGMMGGGPGGGMMQGGPRGGLSGKEMFTQANQQLMGLFGKEGGIVNTNNIARQIMADEGDIVKKEGKTGRGRQGFIDARLEKEQFDKMVQDISSSPEQQAYADAPWWRKGLMQNPNVTGGTMWTPGSGAFKFVPALFKTGAKYFAKKHAMDGAEVPKENMQAYKPNVTIIIT